MTNTRLQYVLPFLFILLCAPLSVFLATNEPPGQVPDEHAHAVKAYSLTLGELIGHREVGLLGDGSTGLQQGIDADPGILAVSTEPSPAQLTSEHWQDVHRAAWGTNTFLAIGTISGYWPGFYVPAALGFAAAKRLGASPYDAFITARMFNLAVYLVLGTISLTMTKRGQVLMFCTLSVPMSLHLGASVNQDGLIIATSVLAVSLLTRTGAGEQAVAGRFDGMHKVSTALFAMVALAKPPYFPLAGLLLLPFPPLRSHRVWLTRLSLVALVVICAVGWTWITVRFVATPVVRPPAEAGPLWPGPRPAIFDGTDMRAQMQVLLSKPIRFLTIPLLTLWDDKIDLIDEVIGILGYLRIYLPEWLYVFWYCAFGAAVLADIVYRAPRTTPTLPLWQSIFPLICVILIIMGILLSQYLSWTDVGSARINGQQGRYFLPLIPVIAFALPNLARNATAGTFLMVIPVAACLLDVMILPGIIIRYFYMH